MPDRSSFSFYQFFLDFIRRYVGKNMKRNNNQIKYIFHQKQKGFSLLPYEGIIDKIKHTFWLISIMKRYQNMKRPFPVYQSQYDTFWVKNVSREVERNVYLNIGIPFDCITLPCMILSSYQVLSRNLYLSYLDSLVFMRKEEFLQFSMCRLNVT